jgi:tetratricopeptide (TPR) repeat protein/cytochrome c553
MTPPAPPLRRPATWPMMKPFRPGCGPTPRSALGPAVAVALSFGVGACSDPEPTWSGEVASLVYTHCAACHHPEGIGPMSLRAYEDVARISDQIAEEVGARRMPPWLPAGDGAHFQGDRRLSDREIRQLQRWIAAGMPRGDMTREPAPPTRASGWVLGEPDLVITMETPFRLPATHHHDIYRNFVLPIPIEGAGRWVRAVEFLPGNPRVVHHATMQVDPTRSSRLIAEADPEPGYDDRVFHSAARPPGGFFLAWTPGLVPAPYPDGMAWRAEPGMDFVVQLHMFPTGQVEEVTFQVGLHFTDDEPDIHPLILRLGGQTIDIPPGEANYRVEDEFLTPVDLRVLGVYPHAHFIGRSVEAWADAPDGRRIPLMSIPDWDFHWQDAYYYQEPVAIPAGSRLKMLWRFDNSASNPRNPNRPPERVVWGLNSVDEMAEFWLQVVTADAASNETLQRAARNADAAKQIEGWEFLVGLNPDDADAQRGLATVAMARGDLDEACRRFQRALEAEPRMALAHHGLGNVLEERGDPVGALAAYRAALDALPGNPPVLADLGRLLASRGDVGEARRVLERAVALDPHAAAAQNNLGSLLRDLGEIEQAIPHFEIATLRAPNSAEAHLNLALARLTVGQRAAGVEALNRGLALDPENLSAALSAAWILATHPDEAARDGALAADLALQIRALTGPDLVVSDVAAAAFAAMGRFPEAIQLATEALQAGQDQAIEGARLDALRRRLSGYVAGQPWVNREGT